MEPKGQQWTVMSAATFYDNKQGYPTVKPVHALAHLIAANLTHSDHMMDFNYARSQLPAYRIAGFESEPIAAIYNIFLEEYPPESLKSGEQGVFYRDTLPEGIRMSCRFQDGVEFNKIIAKLGLFRRTLPENMGSQEHRQELVRYAKSGKSLKYPSMREMRYHFDCAKELCEDFASRHEGLYPSQMPQEELLDLPLSEFAYAHHYPKWLKDELRPQMEAQQQGRGR